MYQLTISHDDLTTMGSDWLYPTMLYAATTEASNPDVILVVRYFFGYEIMEVLKEAKRKGARSSVFALMLASPPHLNGSSKWTVEVIENFGRAFFADSHEPMFSVYGYRTSSGSTYIDNSLPNPSLIASWKSLHAIPASDQVLDSKIAATRGKLAATLSKLVNDANLQGIFSANECGIVIE